MIKNEISLKRLTNAISETGAHEEDFLERLYPKSRIWYFYYGSKIHFVSRLILFIEVRKKSAATYLQSILR